MKARFPILCLVLWLFSGGILFGQENQWDRALDQYDFFCRKSLELRSRAASGENVSQQELVSLLTELSQLRTQLKEAEGVMTPAQRMRFDRIRMAYQGVPERERAQKALPSGPEWIPHPYALPAPPKQLASHPFEHEVTPQQPNIRFGVILLAGIPEGSLGGMFLFQKGPWGAYVKGSSTLRHMEADGICYGDGTTPNGYIWTTGRARNTRFGISAGGSWQPFPFLGFYVGAGYGKQQLFWEDASGRWMQVADKSVNGVLLDAGIMAFYGRWAFLAGVSAINFKTPSAQLGLGFCF